MSHIKTNTDLQLANALYARACYFGGATLDSSYNEPKLGYLTAINKGLEFKYVSAVNEHQVSKWIKDNKSFVKQNGYYFGSWTDETTGKVYFDIVACFTRFVTAVKVAKKFNQIAIWNVLGEIEIRIH